MLNWLVRYAVLAADLEPPADGRLATSVLDVGCGSVGLSCVCPDARFAGQDLHFPNRVAETMFAIRTDPGPFPWVDGAFDTVVSLDALEHVPHDQRGTFVAECARVAARRVFLCCPTSEAQAVDEFFAEMYRHADTAPPAWLDEHVELGLPAPEEIEAACDAVETFTRAPWPQVNGLLTGLAAVGDLHPFFATQAADEYRDQRERWIAVLQAARFNEGVRRGVLLTRDSPIAPVVDPARFDESAARALRCPACGEPGLVRTRERLRCAACRLEITPDEQGALDLRPAEASRRRWWRRLSR